MHAARIASQPGGLALPPMTPLTPQDIQLLESCPRPGEGVHTWTFRVLCMLAQHTRYDSELREVARRYIRRYATRAVPDSEIESQISNARLYASGWSGASPGGPKQIVSTDRSPKWPPADLVAIERIVREGPTLAELIKRSPIYVDHGGFPTSTILEVLFPGDPLLCCGSDKYTFETMPRSAWTDLGRMQFIVPSPMSNVQGRTKEKKLSYRSLDNTGPKRFQVVEFDFKPVDSDNQDGGQQHGRDSKASLVRRLNEDGFSVLDMCSALLWHLAQHRKLALVVHSGGKSLHGWFYCNGEADESLKQFMKYAVQLGADTATWSPSQPLRMPEGTRTDAAHQGVRQAVHYFNPAAIH